MNCIPIYEAQADDFSGNGLGLLFPISCVVEERMNGLYELTCVLPLDGEGQHHLLRPGRILKAVCPVSEAVLCETADDDGVDLWRVSASSARLYADRGQGRTLTRCRRGTLVEALETDDTALWKVRAQSDGAVGYMAAKCLSFFRRERRKDAGGSPEARLRRQQLFRIYAVERDTQLGRCTAWAQHVFYDLRGAVAVQGGAIEAWTNGAQVLRTLFESALTPAPTAHRLILPEEFDRPLKLETFARSFPQLLLEEDGALAQLGAVLYRDNFDLYVLRRREQDLGVTLRRGKNLAGCVMTEDVSPAVTEIIAYARDEDGHWTRFGGDGEWRSPRAEEAAFPRLVMRRFDLQAGDARTPTSGDVYAAIERAVRAAWENGEDRPQVTLRLEMAEAPADERDRALQAVHMFDTVRVIDEALALDGKFVVIGGRWNVLLECFEELVLQG